MVTPTYGTAVFLGLQTKKLYNVDFYISDVIGALCTWDSGAGATSTSNNYWIAPEMVQLQDLSIATGPTVMTALAPLSDFNLIGSQRFRIANFLNSLTTRPNVAITFAQGRRISLVQS